MLKLNAKIIVPSLLACAVAAGCSNANKKSAAPQASALPPMNQAALEVVAAPAPPPAPPEAYTPPAPAQPVVYDPPAEEPTIEEAVVDASDYDPPVARARPRRTAGTRYKIKKGESLWSIAQARYGNGNKWKAIAAANPKIDPDRVQAGQTITLP